MLFGADVHKRSHTFVAVDQLGRKLGEKTARATSAGHTKVIMWAREEFGTDLVLTNASSLDAYPAGSTGYAREGGACTAPTSKADNKTAVDHVHLATLTG